MKRTKNIQQPLRKSISLLLLCLFVFNIGVVSAIHPAYHHCEKQHAQQSEISDTCPFCSVGVSCELIIEQPDNDFINISKDFIFVDVDNSYCCHTFVYKPSRAPPMRNVTRF
ncbi:MAG: YfgG family protein [Prevotellaceae bacterium]|jgi:hypothetical protein|nr:YfgG family protein [Prevotellaceae bacterium]